MRETSALYKSIRGTPGYHYNVNVICNETEEVYGMDKLKSVHIKPMLFAENGPSIGNACSTECDIILKEDSENWPRMASFEVKIQIMSEDNTQVSEWLSMGTFYTDERAYTVSGDLSIIGFDAMLMMEKSWTDKITPPLNWPITAKAWVDLIEDANVYVSGNLLTSFADFPESAGYPIINLIWNANKTRASVKCNSSVNYYNYIGIYDPLDWEMPSVLEYDTPYRIQYSTTDTNVKLRVTVNGEATDYTGDAILTVPEGGVFSIEIKIEKNSTVDSEISLSMPKKIEFDSRTVVDDSIAFIGLDTTSTIRDVLKTIAAAHGGNWVMTEEEKLRLVPFKNSGSSADGAIAGIAIAGVAIVGTSGGGDGSGTGEFYLGMNVRSFSCNTALDAITGVHLETEGGSYSTAGTDTGYVLKGMCNFASSTGVADICLSKTSGYVYRGFDAITAYLDPAYEIGDLIMFDNVAYQMMTITWNINHRPTADISAPYEEEIDHEYEIISESAKTLRKVDTKLLNYPTNDVMQSAIEQSAEAIELSVSELYYNKTEVDTIQQGNEANFTLTAQQIQAALAQISTVEGEVQNINYYIRYEVIQGVGTVIVGQTNSLAELRITNEQISLIYNGDIISYWNQNKQYTPKQLEIPLGGGFKIGNIQWQPRTSGNLSVFLVNV